MDSVPVRSKESVFGILDVGATYLVLKLTFLCFGHVHSMMLVSS